MLPKPVNVFTQKHFKDKKVSCLTIASKQFSRFYIKNWKYPSGNQILFLQYKKNE